MRIILFTYLLLLSARVHAQNNSQVTAELIAMELNRSKAIAAHDSFTLDKMYAAEFKGVNALGYSVSKRDLMALFRRDNPSVVFTNNDHEVTLIRDDVAVLTGRLTGRDRSTGKMISLSVFIHVLVMREGRWQILRAQGTNLPVDN